MFKFNIKTSETGNVIKINRSRNKEKRKCSQLPVKKKKKGMTSTNKSMCFHCKILFSLKFSTLILFIVKTKTISTA